MRAYGEVGDEREQTSADRAPPDLLDVEVVVAENGEYVHDDEQEEKRRRHPLGDGLHQRQREDLESLDVVQDAERADDPQHASDAQDRARRAQRQLHQSLDHGHHQDDEVEQVPLGAPVSLRIDVQLPPRSHRSNFSAIHSKEFLLLRPREDRA